MKQGRGIIEHSAPGSGFHHVSVMADQVVALAEEGGPWATFLDGTLGAGGHSFLLLQRFSQARLLGFDRDQQALEAARHHLEPFTDRITLFHDCFDAMDLHVRDIHHPVFCLLDVGVSSPQLDQAQRGFSFLKDGPLDMRMDQQSNRPLSACLPELSFQHLRQILWEYGEERYAGPIARAILADRPQTTLALAQLVARCVPKPWKPGHHPATRTFQALRIWLNDELGQLDRWLERLPQWLPTGSRVVVISFHSLEDRRIKRKFRHWATACHCPPQLPLCRCGGVAKARLVGKQPRIESPKTCLHNPRARSAKLRVIDWLGDPSTG